MRGFRMRGVLDAGGLGCGGSWMRGVLDAGVFSRQPHAPNFVVGGGLHKNGVVCGGEFCLQVRILGKFGHHTMHTLSHS
jgi:hypothetical protein